MIWCDLGNREASLPMRERGLKPIGLDHNGEIAIVAPHAGAWIETALISLMDQLFAVAPHAGAWIETICKTIAIRIISRSPCGSVD